MLPNDNFIYNLRPVPMSVGIRVQETMGRRQLQGLLSSDRPVGVVVGL